MKAWKVVGKGYEAFYSCHEHTRLGALANFLRLFGVKELGKLEARTPGTSSRALDLIDPAKGGEIVATVREVAWPA